MTTSHATSRFRQLAARLARAIDAGIYGPGERMPSLRRLARQEHLSVTTALEAYGLLESRGYLQARPRSGYFVRPRPRPQAPRPATETPPLPVAVTIADLAATLLRQRQTPGIVSLGDASPGAALLPSRRLDRLLAARLRRRDPAHGDCYPPGDPLLRRLIARRSFDWGGALGADDIVVTQGGTQAIGLCLRAVTRPGDLVAVESPCYFGTLLLLESLGLSALEIPTDPAHGLPLARLRAALDRYPVRACVVSPCFSNPTGSCMTDDDKRQLVALLAERQLPLIEDDTYGDTGFGDTRPLPAKAFDRNGTVMLCASFSKILAPGYRLGWVAPGRWRRQVERLQLAGTLAAPALFQQAVADFLAAGGYDRHLRALRSALATQASRALTAVARDFPAGTRTTRPRGGMVLWLTLPPPADALALATQARAAGIGICPGPLFSATGGYRHCLRLGYGQPWTPALDRALATLGQLAGA